MKNLVQEIRAQTDHSGKIKQIRRKFSPKAEEERNSPIPSQSFESRYLQTNQDKLTNKPDVVFVL